MRVLIPLPRYGFDPTEAAVPWSYLKAADHSVIIATPDGKEPKADFRMLTGEDLGIFKSMLRCDHNGAEAYTLLECSREFQNPISYGQLEGLEYDAVFLPGGHDKGMREYLDSRQVQGAITAAFAKNKRVGAICHGTLAVGRSLASNGKSVLYGKKTTGLTRLQEIIPYFMTRSYLGDYYRTYPEKDQDGKIVTLEDELKSYLKDPSDFIRGPGVPIPLLRDTPDHLSRGFVLRDGNYFSARWPGDAHHMGSAFAES